MKRMTLALLFVSVCSNAAEVLDTYVEGRPARIGVEAGATFSNVSSPADINAENRSGLAAGVKMEVPFTHYLAIQPEVLFVQRGATLISAGNARLVTKYNTIEVPVLLKASLPTKVSPYLTAGPIMFFNVSSSAQASTPAGTATASFQPRTFEFGVSLGGGVEFGPVFLAANYLVGLTDINETGASYQSRGVQVLGGVQF
jgi:hypothetical protein